MTDDYWPLFGLRLATVDLELRPMTEADQSEIARLLPTDVELDPAATRFAGANERIARGRITHQAYWRAYGNWTTAAWRLSFVVRRDGAIIGAQELEGNDFLALRTVDTASFLVPSARGGGLGKQMRSAVLSLAFGPLEAQAAITSAWHDNHASLGVSRALGYQPNGEMLHRRDDGTDRMVHLRLTRSHWLGQPRAESAIDGFDTCRPLFGLDPLPA